jgi:XrtJ-associated TM-motif-TM protein
MTMNRSLMWVLVSVAVLFVAIPLHAQSGCADSPENPTIVLGVVGSAGAFFSTMRARRKARRGSSTN